MSINYHPNKANLLANAPSRLSMGSITRVEEERNELGKDVHSLVQLGVHIMIISDCGVTIQNGLESSFVEKTKKNQYTDLILLQLKGAIHYHIIEVFL